MRNEIRWPPVSLLLRARALVFPSVFFAVGMLLSKLAGFRFYLYTDEWHLLSSDLLTHDAARSIYLLHSQPPLLNMLAAVVYKLGAQWSVPPSRPAEVLLALFGWGTVCVLFVMVRTLTSSRLLAAAAVIVVVADPGFWFYGNFFFYDTILLFQFTLCAWLLYLYLRDGRVRHLAGLTFTIVSVVWLRALYMPLWAVATLATAVIARSASSRHSESDRSRATLVVLAVGALLLIAWPAKNALLYGQWTYTTWTAYNLRAGSSTERRSLQRFIHRGLVPDDVRAALDSFKRKHGLETAPAIEDVLKADGSRNWNHYIFVVENRGVWGRTLRYVAKRPLKFLAESAGSYWQWSDAAYRNSYTDGIEGPESRAYRDYAGWHRRLFFADLSKLSARPDATPTLGLRHGSKRTVFGLIVFPLLLLGTVRRIWRPRPEGRRHEPIYLGILLFWVCWNLAVPALSDAVEISRMRFPMMNILVVLAVLALPTRGARGA